jgi:hypothetical protein
MTCCGKKRMQFRSHAARREAAGIAPARTHVAAERTAERPPEQEFAPRHQMLDLQAAAGNQAVQSLLRKAAASGQDVARRDARVIDAKIAGQEILQLVPGGLSARLKQILPLA